MVSFPENIVHKAIKPFLSKKQQGQVMGALRAVLPLYDPRSPQGATMPVFKVTLRHVNNPDNVVEMREEAINPNFAADAAKRRYMLPANWDVVGVELVADDPTV